MPNDWNGIGMTSEDAFEEFGAEMFASGSAHCGECGEVRQAANMVTIDGSLYCGWCADPKGFEASRNMAQAWQSISGTLPEFYYVSLWQMVHENVTDNTTTTNLSKSVCELALYVKLTGEVPDDPFKFFDFNK